MQTSATYLLTDSRHITSPAQSIFFAIRGIRHNGHRYLRDVYLAGVREFVVEKGELSGETGALVRGWKDASVHVVENSLRALQDLAASHRAQFDIPVLGITGSNGKTIVKEWLAQLLGYDEVVAASPKSYNSQVGVPLSVWNIHASHTIGIFEAGISQPQEMELLQQIIRPSMGIFTNIGPAHDEGFRSTKQKITEKLKLFQKSGKLIYRSDYSLIREEVDLILRAANPELRPVTWATYAEADYRVSFRVSPVQTVLAVTMAGESSYFTTSFRDDASLENLVHCIVFLLDYGMAAEIIQDRIQRLRPVSMRLELKEGIAGSRLIDDTYNNDLQGLTMALAFLGRQDPARRKMVVLSDVLQSGLRPEDLYGQIATLLKGENISRLIGIGPEIGRHLALFDLPDADFYTTTEEFLRACDRYDFADALILVKGARPFAFERIVNRLQQKVHGTVLEINLDALTHNLNFYRSRLTEGTKVMVMVKAFAYGSGSAEVAALLQFHKVDYLGVAYTDEGVMLRQNGIRLPVMVMNPSSASFDALVKYDLEPEMYSRRILTEWIHYCEAQPDAGRIPAVHIKLDTGMHRLGFVEEDYDWLAEQLTVRHTFLKVAGIFSHLVGADDGVHNTFSALQYARFVRGTGLLEQAIGKKVLKHILNSAGIVRFPEYQLDMVRLGIGLYGVDATGLEQEALQPASCLKTVISQIKELPAGESVGYGRRGKVGHASRIGTLAIGYADGLDRRLGNGVGRVWVADRSGGGSYCPTVGNICMDMTMVDLTGTAAAEGEEVIVFGKENPIYSIAGEIGTIPYELLTGVSERVKRVFYKV